MTKQSLTYQDAGVSIDAGNALVERIKGYAKSTTRPGAEASLGGFGALFDLAKTGYKDPILVSGTDGVGTKLHIAAEVGKHDTIGIDLVAMCVNDLVVQGAEPLFFLDYFACGALDVDVAADVVKGIAAGCKESGCALIGGETAEMPGMYANGAYDLAGFAVGVVERGDILPRSDVQAGDVIIGLPSSGVHSNGFSMVRHIIKLNNIAYDKPQDFTGGKTLGEVLLTPTKLYIQSCLKLLRAKKVKALAHITGGGLLENIPRVLPDGLSANIDCKSWAMPPLFKWLAKTGNVEALEMLRTFNCGIGMVVVVAKEDVADAMALLADSNPVVIGSLGEHAGGEHRVAFQDIDAILA